MVVLVWWWTEVSLGTILCWPWSEHTVCHSLLCMELCSHRPVRISLLTSVHHNVKITRWCWYCSWCWWWCKLQLLSIKLICVVPVSFVTLLRFYICHPKLCRFIFLRSLWLQFSWCLTVLVKYRDLQSCLSFAFFSFWYQVCCVFLMTEPVTKHALISPSSTSLKGSMLKLVWWCLILVFAAFAPSIFFIQFPLLLLVVVSSWTDHYCWTCLANVY